MLKISDKQKDILALLSSFGCPFLLLALVLFSKGIYPGGPNTILIYDLRTQYLSFFSYIRNLGTGFNNLMYQTSSGLGGGCFGSLAYYVGSPLSWIVCLFSDKDLPIAIWLITLLKIGFCGLSFSLFLKYGNLKINKYIILVLFSTSYALMSYNIVNLLNLMFLDGVIMLPIVILGIDRVLDDHKGTLLFFAVFLSVVFNYYTSFMIILFSFIWYFYRIIIMKVTFNGFVRRSVRTLIAGGLGVFSASFILIPVIIDFGRGRSNEIINTGYGIVLRNLFSVAESVLPFSYNGLLNEDSPYIYIGTIMLLLSIAFFASKEIDRRLKASSAVVVLIFCFSFIFTGFDSAWTAMKVSNGYPARYSFCWSFFLLYLGAAYIRKCQKSFINRNLLISILLLFNSIELMLNARYLLFSLDENIGPYSLEYEYEQMNNVAELCRRVVNPDDTSISRTTKFWDYTQLDGMMYGINSLDYYSSSYNYGLHEMMGDMGIEQHLNHVTDKGMTPFTRDLLGFDRSILYYADSPRDTEVMLGSADMCSIYANENALPIAFMISNTEKMDDLKETDPFQAQNIIAEELSGDGDVFNEIEYEILCDQFNEYDQMFIRTVKFTIEEVSEIWLYVDPVYIDFSDVNASDRELLFPSVYYGDEMITEYQSSLSSYCIYLGQGNGDIELNFRSCNEIGEVHFATYNDKCAENVIGLLRNRSAYNVITGSDGISFDIDAGGGGNLIVTLPYEKGYMVYVDGILNDYSGYREALLELPLGGGEHNIRITYFTPGLKSGLIISFAAVVVAALLMTKNIYGKKDRKIN